VETGSAVLMPWKDRVAAIVQAWYPGTSGGEAIANVLFGKVNPSGHLPVTFPASEAQLPRPVRPGTGVPENTRFPIEYNEGAAVGYKWFDARGIKPLFPFGHGLSYTSFALGSLTAAPGPNGGAKVSFTVRNTGKRAGAEVAQVYVSPIGGGWEAPKRLAAFAKVQLAPGQSKTVTLDVDPRLLATFDEASNSWKIGGGGYKLMLGTSATELGSSAVVQLPAATLPGNWRPATASATGAVVPERG